MSLSVAQKSPVLSATARGGLKQSPKATPSPSLEAVLAYCWESLDASYARLFLKKETKTTLATVASYGNQLIDSVAMRLARRALLHGRIISAERRGRSIRQGSQSGLELVGLPVQASGETLGALVLGFFSPNEAQRVSAQGGLAWLLSSLIASELTCDRLKQMLAQKEEQLARSVLESLQKERERLGMELHDSVAQTLASAYQLIQACEATPQTGPEKARPQVVRAGALVKQAIVELRDVINSTAPQTLRELGLIETLRQELKQFEEESGCRVRFDALNVILPMDVTVALYKIVHEAVTNVKKHAQARRLLVVVKERDGEILICVKDWGAGFDPALLEGASIGRSAGLFSMGKRTELLGGTCQVKTRPGSGTEVLIAVPFQGS